MPYDKTILVVDDNAPYRHLICLFLRKHNYIPLEAEDGAEALVIAASQKLKAIILDLQMLPMGGFAFMEEYKQQSHNDVPVILATSDQAKDITARAAERGFAGVLKKPVTEDALIQALHRALA